ncbi:DUF4177 domain-containing protein [Saliphagus sp. LR7]|uniref:DUF4177 domain-containing protein n=1 Tax=Saliphagus sp. LR7 TaxID=2282654 RepID=UPI000DF76320|nr:DUF4177 domain-containing protein [Saliphagus sp. LR7]
MTEQRFEYKTVEFSGSLRKRDAEPTLVEAAAEGWQLVETLDIDGTTYEFVLERPIE